MDLPTAREIELEILLRKRDSQIAELSDEVAHLRRYLSTQPGPSTTEPVTLPPTLVSLLLPHINNASSTGSGSTSSSSSVTAALIQRARLLQEENDELYDLLKQGEIGRMKEEVHGLRRAVNRLEGALRDSHKVISTLSDELDVSREYILSSLQQNNRAKSHPQLPRNSYYPKQARPALGGNGTSKLPPTGPRAQKKPRLSESRGSPPSRPNASLSPDKHHGHANSSRQTNRRASPEGSKSDHTKMEFEEDQRKRPRSPTERDREKDREKDRDKDRDRDRDRDRMENPRDRERDRERLSRRNGHVSTSRGSGGSGRRGDRGASVGDRTLAERMGL